MSGVNPSRNHFATPLVFVERTTRFILMCHLVKKDAASVRAARERKLTDLPVQLRLYARTTCTR